MKSFSQFLKEEEARQGKLFTSKDKPQDFRNPKKVPFTGTDPTPTPASRRLSPGAPEAPKTSPGQLEIPEPKTTRVPGPRVRGAGEMRQPSLITKSGGAQDFTKAGKGRVPYTSSEPVKATKRLPEAPPKAPKTSPGQMKIDFNAKPSSSKPPSTPSPSGGKPPAGQKPTAKLSKLGKFGKALGPAAAAVDTALSTADERAKGSGWARSLAKGATVAAGGLAGGALGALGGGGIGSAALGTAGAIGGAELAGKAFDVAAGANAKERKAMATANRQRQAGSALKGIGGKTTFDTKKNTMTTGTGAQRKTVGLAKTGVVQRGGQSVAGHLAYKGGKAVYKAGPSAQSLAKTSSNPLERIGRTLFAGAYKKHDAAKAQQALAKARQSDAARNKALGVKALPGK